MEFVQYRLAKTPELPPFAGGMYEYWLAANGVFVRAERPGLSATVCVSASAAPIKGLAAIYPDVKIGQRAPVRALARILELSRRAAPKEALFYLRPDGGEDSRWRLTMPEQQQSGGNVRPVDPYNAAGQAALIECHSHHDMGAFFSGTDNKDETGFRIYAVVGQVSSRPEVSVRVGVYGHFWLIPARAVFDLPNGVRDAVYEVEDEREPIYENIDAEF